MLKFGTHTVKIASGFVTYPTVLTPEHLPGFGYNEFNYIGDVYSSLTPDDRVIFLLRHSERPSETGSSVPLTTAGIQYATAVGEALSGGIVSPNDTVYASTTPVRTRQTAQYIATGRGDSNFSTLESIDTSHASEISGSLFTSSTNWPLVSKYSCRFDEMTASELTQFNDKDSTALKLINDLIAALGTKKMGVFISHDFLLVPMSSWCADSQLDLNFYDSGKQNWICYIAGVAIVLRDKHVYTTPVYSIICEPGANGYKGIMHGYGNIL